MDDDGFYMAEIDGFTGLVPSNFLTEAPDQYSSGQTSQQMGSAGRGQRGRGHGPGARGPPPPPRDNTARSMKRGISGSQELDIIKEIVKIFRSTKNFD